MRNGSMRRHAALATTGRRLVTRYVALLRGIGPSDPNMRNAKLREVCENLGFRNVMSVLSSGNLIFDADAEVAEVERRLEAAWPEQLGFHSTSIVRTRDELGALLDLEPFGSLQHGKGSYLLVTFARDPIEVSFTPPIEPLGPGSTVIAVADRELFTVSDTTMAKTPDVMAWLAREFGTTITSRTWLTVQRILARCDA